MKQPRPTVRNIGSLLLLLLVTLPAFANGGLSTGNQFVIARIEDGTGAISFFKGNSLSSPATIPLGLAKFSITVRGRSYTNDTTNQQRSLPDRILTNGTSTRIGDTIETRWKKAGFDVIQDVYPVAFEISGQIVYSLRVLNRFGDTLTAQANYGLRVNISNSSLSGLIPEASFEGNLTSFFLGYQFPPGDTAAGTLSMGYFNDSLSPLPMGLMQPEGIGQAMAVGTGVLNTALLQGTAFELQGSGKDTLMELAKSSYGTGEFEVRTGGGVQAITFYSHRIRYDTVSKHYQPNPFPVESFVFFIGNGAEDPSLSQSVTGPIRIVAPLPVSLDAKSQTQYSYTVPPGGRVFVKWLDTTLQIIGQKRDSIAYLILRVTPWSSYPIVFDTPASMPIIIGNGRNSILAFDTISPFLQLVSAAPGFGGTPCNAQCQIISALDTGASESGIKSIALAQSNNMSLATQPFAQGTQPATFSICVADSMQDASGSVVITDLAGNTRTEQFSYCTIPDTMQPFITLSGLGKGVSLNFHDGRPWDRGLDSIALWDTVNADFSGSTNSLVRGANVFSLGVNRRDTSQPMSYCAAAFDRAGNASKSYCFSSFTGDVSERFTSDISLRVNPNPAREQITIELAGAKSPPDFEISDLLGRVVGHGVLTGSSQFDMRSLPLGTYILRVMAGSQTTSRRIIKN